MKSEIPEIIFIGQPNCGKSTLFNHIAGFKAQTSNFPGTTVSHTHSEVVWKGKVYSIVDLPGTYSLTPYEPQEKVVLTHIFKEKPDLIVNVIDASLLGRSLELTVELLELEYPMVVVLNMMDLAEKKGIKIDTACLEKKLGVPVIKTVAIRGQGTKELMDCLEKVLADKVAPGHLCYSFEVEKRISELIEVFPENFPVVANPRFTAIKAIEAETLSVDRFFLENNRNFKEKLDEVRQELGGLRQAPAYEVLAVERHHLAMKIAEDCSQVHHARISSLEKLDNLIMHPIFGLFLLLLIFAGMFYLIFNVGSPLEACLLRPWEALRLGIQERLGQTLSAELLAGLIQGIGGGLAIVFPYFIPLLLLMGFLEDIGYLSRAAFLLDAFMHRLGLHGKSVPLFILGFGCNVPAIMTTRILESRRDRIVTTLLIPFIPCAARTTIILALVAFLLGPWWAVGFYFLNLVIIAILSSVLTRIFKYSSPGLILEIPSLKWPSPKNILQKTWLNLKEFIRFAWPILIAGSVLLSFLSFINFDRLVNTVLSPFVSGLLGLPQSLGVTLIFGVLRKELSLLMMFQALGVGYEQLLTVITKTQLLTFVTFVNFFIPCISTVAVIWKEMGKRIALISVLLNLSVAILVSWLVRIVSSFF
ncbi:MAG: ferrous iron transport protein B [Acidobacteriota bacterium]|nr:ferrous iron transport protein B [Acidobacteriota bacterium]MDY0231356.1 ferrous iron transport protein B [Candidatus Saccharicenans sp.]